MLQERYQHRLMKAERLGYGVAQRRSSSSAYQRESCPNDIISAIIHTGGIAGVL